MYNIHKAPLIAYFAPTTYEISVPAAVSSTCKSCRGSCDLGSTICGGCLDILEGTAELKLPAVRRCAEHEESCTAPYHFHDDHDEPDTDEVKVVRPASPELDEQFDLSADVVTVSLCATCTDATTHRCVCGRLVCADCCDDAGRCPVCS